MGQQQIEEKSNEITAIPKRLSSLDLEEAVVSIDTTGTQTKIAEQIIKQKGHYFLSVKSNQKGLLDDLEHAFKVDKCSQFFAGVECDHGRIENRNCSILPVSDCLLEETKAAWKHVSTIINIEAGRETRTGVLQRETRYYISNETFPSPSYCLALARGHRVIENQLHWHLDVTFKEDDCRAGQENAPLNLSTLRKFALQVLSGQMDKLSLKKDSIKPLWM